MSRTPPFFAIMIPVYIQVQGFAPAQAGKHHDHGKGSEIMLIAGVNDQFLFPLFKAAVFTGRSLRRLDVFGRTPEKNAVLNSCLEDAANGDIYAWKTENCIIALCLQEKASIEYWSLDH